MDVECLALKDLTSPRKKSFTVEPEEDEGQSEQKENICSERKKSTPLKSAESPVPFLIIRKVATPDLAHITPIKHTALAEPWTPTANLKMLISAASPDIRDREMKKVLFRPIENEKEKPPSPEAVVEDTEFEAADEEDDADKKPSRKQKSLGLLCQKFLALYPDYPPPHKPIWISLCEVASSLGAERRRIYDIINVLESLMIVGRIAKNSYTWYGRQRLEATLEDLQRRGLKQGYHLQMAVPADARDAVPGCEDDRADGDAGNGGNRKDKSLRIMSQKFVMLFLVSKTQTVTLDAAAKILIEESQDSSSHNKYKTKVRRLYDIANILTSLDLIKKVYVGEERGRKPAFEWLGPVEFKNSGNGAVSLPGVTQPITRDDIRQFKMTRHASFNVTPTSAAVQRQVSSAPSSPRREPTGLQNQPVDYSKKTPSNNPVCQVKFDHSTEIHPRAAQQNPACSATSTSPQPTSHATLMAPPLHPEHLFTSSPSSHCLAYLPSLSQPSVVMLFKPEGQRSPGWESAEGRKRRRKEEEEEVVVKKKGTSGLEEEDKMTTEAHRESAECSTRTSPRHTSGLSAEPAVPEIAGVTSSNEPAQPSHYLFVPNTAGLNSLNFLFSAGQSPAGLALPPSSVPTLPLPYILLPSPALPHYPLVAGSLQQQASDAHSKLSFSLPAAHFMVGAGPFGFAAASDVGRSPVPPPSTPEQSRMYGSVSGAPQSPAATCHTIINTPEPLTPHTPDETTQSASKAFFRTPGTLGNVVGTVPVARKRGPAHRRLDVGHSTSTCLI